MAASWISVLRVNMIVSGDGLYCHAR